MFLKNSFLVFLLFFMSSLFSSERPLDRSSNYISTGKIFRSLESIAEGALCSLGSALMNGSEWWDDFSQPSFWVPAAISFGALAVAEFSLYRLSLKESAGYYYPFYAWLAFMGSKISSITTAHTLRSVFFNHRVIYIEKKDDLGRRGLCSEINVDLQRTKLLLKYAGFLIRAALQFPLLVDHKNTQCIFTSCLNTMCYNLRKKPSPENQTDLVAIARFLCECGINPRYTYNNQQNLLTVAHLTKHTLLTDFLLKECGLDPHNRDEIIQARTDKGIAISASMYSVISPLIIASYENDDTWVELLIKSERPEHKPQIHPFRDMSGRYPPAIRAIKNKNPKMFDMLWNYTLNKNDPSRPAAIWTICAFNNPVQSTIELFPPEVLNEIKQVYVLLDQKVRKKNMKTMIDICFECDEKIWPAPIGRKNTTYISSPTRVYSLDDERVKMGPEAYGHSTLKERSNLINGWKQEVKDWLIERDRIREIVIIDTANRPLEIAAKT